MPEDIPPPGLTPTNYQRTTGGKLQWQPPTPEHLAAMLPQYEIECLLGRGGMGAVYKGRQKSLDQTPSLPDAAPRSHRPRCGGRESKFLAASQPMEGAAMVGDYGYYESIDYARQREPGGEAGIVVHCYMVHHQGMSLLAFDNALHEGVMRTRFHSDPRIRASEALLHEHVPVSIAPTTGEVREERPAPRVAPITGEV